MAKGPKHEPEVTNLARYRRQKAEAAKRKPPAPKPPRPGGQDQSVLGSNPRAGLILAIAIVLLLAFSLGPMLL